MKSSNKYISEYNQIYKTCSMVYRSVAAGLGLSECSFWILYIIRDTEGICRQADICENMSMPRQTVNSAIKKLEKDGYLSLSGSGGKRGKAICLTDQGERFVEKNILPVMEAEDRVCQSFSEEEKEIFLHQYRLLSERLSEELGK